MARVRNILFTAPVLILVLLAIPVVAELASGIAQEAGLTRHDAAYYLDPDLINFIRPGVRLKITSATIQNSQISVRFTLADPAGLPLDREGITTPGVVSTSFIAAYIPKDATLYTAYTTRTQTSPITGKSAVQAGTDSGGTYTKNGDGDYTYTFATRVPATYDASLTHSIGIYGRRNLAEFLTEPSWKNTADAVYTWVPNGSAVKTVRDIVKTEVCNSCHDPLFAHGGTRQKVELCILCHQPQTVDPDTGNSVDMTEMVHKIHRGESLPSVVAGKPYVIIGNAQSVNDYSTVGFPDDVRRCEACHRGATQSAVYLTRPSRWACGACHDNVNFQTGENHLNLPQVSDNLCATCHIPQGELEFDASIKGAHTIANYSSQLPGTTFQILRVDNCLKGQKPRVTFTVKDKKGNVIDVSKMASGSLILAGPTTDYTQYWSEDIRAKSVRSGDQWVYDFTQAIPADAAGSYAVGIQGYNNIVLNPGTKQEQTVRDPGFNAVSYFSVDNSKIAPRRRVVSQQTCTTCHGSLYFHGGSRQSVEFCVFCHSPNYTDVSRRTKPELLPAESINFKTMIHKIHTGEDLQTDFTVYGYGNTAHNYNEVRFPTAGEQRNCDKCHVSDSYQLPLPKGVIAQVAPRDWINPLLPITGACLSCHTSQAAAAHAATMTSDKLGEACAACHGTNSEFSIDKVHAR
jgi:OmcA/MtrC family decaheme c-type cytochrome